MAVMYDRPSFTLKPSDETIEYANVLNTLEVVHKGRELTKTVEIPTILFTVMRRLGVPKDCKVQMYLDDCGKRMVFGIELIGADQFIDLWYYTFDKIPQSLLTVR